MRWTEIIMTEKEPAQPIAPVKPKKPVKPCGGGVPPLTPKQARARSDKLATANARVADVAAGNAQRMSAATRARSNI